MTPVQNWNLETRRMHGILAIAYWPNESQREIFTIKENIHLVQTPNGNITITPKTINIDIKDPQWQIRLKLAELQSILAGYYQICGDCSPNGHLFIWLGPYKILRNKLNPKQYEKLGETLNILINAITTERNAIRTFLHTGQWWGHINPVTYLKLASQTIFKVKQRRPFAQNLNTQLNDFGFVTLKPIRLNRHAQT